MLTAHIFQRKIIKDVFDPKVYDSTMPSNPPVRVRPYFLIHHVESIVSTTNFVIIYSLTMSETIYVKFADNEHLQKTEQRNKSIKCSKCR